jgi:hypothetical protein
MSTEHNIFIGDRDALSEIEEGQSANERIIAAANEACGVFVPATPHNLPPARPARRHLTLKRGPSVKRVARIADRIHARPEYANLDLAFILGAVTAAAHYRRLGESFGSSVAGS